MIDKMLRAGFPDNASTIEDLVAEGDKVVAYKTLTGTHSGPHLGIPATNKPVQYQIISIYSIKNGKIDGYWGLQDEMSLMRQFGVIA
jgi:predicted ester cyclase